MGLRCSSHHPFMQQINSRVSLYLAISLRTEDVCFAPCPSPGCVRWYGPGERLQAGAAFGGCIPLIVIGPNKNIGCGSGGDILHSDLYLKHWQEIAISSRVCCKMSCIMATHVRCSRLALGSSLSSLQDKAAGGRGRSGDAGFALKYFLTFKYFPRQTIYNCWNFEMFQNLS